MCKVMGLVHVNTLLKLKQIFWCVYKCLGSLFPPFTAFLSSERVQNENDSDFFKTGSIYFMGKAMGLPYCELLTLIH